MNRHAVYGDDDQENLARIFSQEDEILKLVEASNRQTMKDRLKNVGKKKSVDVTVNAIKPEEIPEDVKEGKIEKKKKKDSMIDMTSFETPKQKVKKPKKEKKPKEKANPKSLLYVFLILFLIISLGVLWAFKDEISVAVDNLKVSLNEAADAYGSNNLDNNSEINTGGEEGLKTVVNASVEANTKLRTFYEELVSIANTTKDEYVIETLASKQNEVIQSRQSFEAYKSLFEQYQGGQTYYESTLTRYTNLETLLAKISTLDSSQIPSALNEGIDEENVIIAEQKASLKAFLDMNGLTYTETENSIEVSYN